MQPFYLQWYVKSHLQDNPAFIVKASEAIPSKKTIQLSIGYKQPASGAPNEKEKAAATPAKSAPAPAAAPVQNVSKTGKLTITNQNTNTAWVYYLKYVPN